MNKPIAMSTKRVQVCVTVDEDLLEWVNEKIESKEFRNKSHAFESSMAKMKKLDEMRSGMTLKEDGSVVLKPKKKGTGKNTVVKEKNASTR